MREFSVSLLNETVDVSREFGRPENVFFHCHRLAEFDAVTRSGVLECPRYALKPRMAFNQFGMPYEETQAWEFPPAYGDALRLPFALSFPNARTIRLRLRTRPSGAAEAEAPSLVLRPDLTVAEDDSWTPAEEAQAVIYRGRHGSVQIDRDPWHVEIRDAGGRLLTRTQHFGDTYALHNTDPTPFTVLRRAQDLRRYIAAAFRLGPDEKLFGGGESFTRLNKRGQKLPLWTRDALGVQTRDMYKPVPFFLSSAGYGMFVHTTAPLTLDLGSSYDGSATVYLGDDTLDLFVFLGTPKEILSEYTALTGRSPVPPLWSFGLWMSRITYQSESEVRAVAATLREHRIPCDVIHLDTGWFETDWRCDYRFAASRFEDPQGMIADLKARGFRVCLWQLPYFTPQNALFPELVTRGWAVRGPDGGRPTEDAILDFSHPDAVRWYEALLRRLFAMGVACIKADFGEAAPLHGRYASGRSGWLEHNAYPLRYNRAVFDVTREATGAGVIWARSAWAGSQRYPLHWGGDAENTDCGMAATLRAGLSLGLCGFTFWSHDIGGFVKPSPAGLYRRWMPFGMLTSHSRCHGAPPKEPWPYGKEFEDDFRRACELKYALMPYVYAQAVASAARGFPMMRALFFEFPADPGSWRVEDEYLFGEDLLVAPLLEEDNRARQVYLPAGRWIDYQTRRDYDGGRWHEIEAGQIPIVLLVRDGAAIPHAAPAQCTDDIDWTRLRLTVFSVSGSKAEGKVALPGRNEVHVVRLRRRGDAFAVQEDPFDGAVRWTVTH